MTTTTMKNENAYMNYDEKILNYKGNDYEEFMALFDEEDVLEMRLEMESFDYEYDYLPVNEVKEIVIADYVRHILILHISNNVISGTRQLFRLVYDVM